MPHVWWAILGVAVFILLIGAAYYNGFVTRRNQVDQAFSTIDAILKQRADLVPNLVATVQRYMQHESTTLERITSLRSRVGSTQADSESRVKASNELDRLLGGIMLQVENYPELKANESVTRLQSSLGSLEEQLSAARRTFNAAVTGFNNAIETFPGNLLAGLFGFRRKSLLEIPPGDRNNPDVHALFNR